MLANPCTNCPSKSFLGLTTPELNIPPPEKDFSRKALPIDLDKVLIVPKLSKIEYQMRLNGEDFSNTLTRLEAEYGDIDGLLKSHFELEESKRELLLYFRKEQILDLSEISPEKARNASLVIALGGDDHFCAVTQRLSEQTPILGLKADNFSVGVLLDHQISELSELVNNLADGHYSFEAWTRLRVNVDGQELPPAISTVFIGENNAQYTSRNRTKIEGSDGGRLYGTEGLGVEQRSSGILIYTGTGSTGWPSSASLYLFPEGRTFSRTARYAEFILREPTVPKLGFANSKNSLPATVMHNDGLPALIHAPIKVGEKITIKSLNKDSAIVSADSVNVPFRRGSEVSVEIDPEPLWVIVKNKTEMNKEFPQNCLKELLSIEIPHPNCGVVSKTLKDKNYPERFRAKDPEAHYNPPYYEHEKLITAPWAEKGDFSRQYFANRKQNGELKSFCGEVELDSISGMPLNPVGKTGIRGRGVLGKYGANFAVDPVVIAFDKNENAYYLLEILRNSGRWALPGGMVDKGEFVMDTIYRELEEETSISKDDVSRFLVQDFSLDIYADDPRSTDNAWIETSARAFLLDKSYADSLHIKAGDDAKDIRWRKIDKESIKELYGSHPFIVLETMRYFINRA